MPPPTYLVLAHYQWLPATQMWILRCGWCLTKNKETNTCGNFHSNWAEEGVKQAIVPNTCICHTWWALLWKWNRACPITCWKWRQSNDFFDFFSCCKESPSSGEQSCLNHLYHQPKSYLPHTIFSQCHIDPGGWTMGTNYDFYRKWNVCLITFTFG